MYASASALPGEIRLSKICVKNKQKTWKNVPDIIDRKIRNLKKD